MAITTRSGKGSALTHTEMDTNFKQVPNGSDSSITDTGTNIGIGTTPVNPLTVGALEASSDDQNGTVGIKCNADSRGIVLQEYSGAEQWEIGVGTTGNLNFHDSGNDTPFMTILDVSGDMILGTYGVGNKYIRLWGDSNGQINIGGEGTTSDNRLIFQNANGSVGSIATSGSATSYNTSSDYRLKENVVPMTNSIDRLKELKPSRFNFIADANITVDGFLAHEAGEVVPEAISGDKDAVDEDGKPEYQGIDQSKLVPLLVSAVQELTAKVEALEAQLGA